MRAESQGLSCDGMRLLDAQGRVRILRGVNLSGRSKQPPFVPISSPELLDPLVDWGFNVVRLLLTWEGVEPLRGEYDESYLDTMVELAHQAHQRGLCVLVDMHQDIFSRGFGGDGAPSWVVDNSKPPPPNRQWFLRYFTSRSVRKAQREFWTDRHGHLGHFLGALRRVMERMRDVEGVIGYDPWNEPMSGVRQVVSGQFERKILSEFYAQCSRMRDEVDPGRLIFAEPTPLSALGTPTALRLPPNEGFVYAPHIYDAGAITLGRYASQVSTFPRTLAHHLETAQRMDVPLFFGEFGVLNWVRGGRTMLEHECRMFDRHFLSWSVWHYNPTDQDWNDENASFVEPDGSARPWALPLFRPYPMALAGRPDSWESKEGQPWTLRFHASPGGTSQFVVPRAWARAVQAEVTGGEHEVQGDRLFIRSDGGPVRVVLHR